IYPMRSLGASGVWEIFVPGLEPGALYKYEIVAANGDIRVKTDPFAFKMEQSPGTSSIVERPPSAYEWNDAIWMSTRDERDVKREPMLAYEVHLGSWARVVEEGNRFLTYRELAIGEKAIALLHDTRPGSEVDLVREHRFALHVALVARRHPDRVVPLVGRRWSFHDRRRTGRLLHLERERVGLHANVAVRGDDLVLVERAGLQR